MAREHRDGFEIGRLGDRDGTRALIEVLLLQRSIPAGESRNHHGAPTCTDG